MKVSELIDMLKDMPPDADVGYENSCADDGRTHIEVTEVERSDQIGYWAGYKAPQGAPKGLWIRLS